MEPRANEILPQTVEEYIDGEVLCTVVDVREDMEVAQGMIEHAKHIPLKLLPFSLNELDPTSEIICVCHSGQRSNVAALFLEEKGFKAMNMVGGMLEWTGEIFTK